MSFDAAYIQRLDKQMQSAQRELNRVNRFERQHRRMVDTMLGSLGNSLQGVAARAVKQHRVPLQRTVLEAMRPSISTMLQDVTKAAATSHAKSYQKIAGIGVTSSRLAMQRNIAEAAAKPFISTLQGLSHSIAATPLSSFQNLGGQLATTSLRMMGGLDTSVRDTQLNSINKMAWSGFQAQLKPFQGFAFDLAKSYVRCGGAMSALDTLNSTVFRTNRLASSSALGMLNEYQARLAPSLGQQVAQAVSEAVRISPALGPLPPNFEGYKLRDVRVIPEPRETGRTYQPTVTSPEPTPYTQEAPAEVEQPVKGALTSLATKTRGFNQ